MATPDGDEPTAATPDHRPHGDDTTTDPRGADTSTAHETSPGPAPPRVLPWVDTLAQYAWRGLVIIVAAAALIWSLATLYLVTIPVVLALVLCTFCVPVARRIERAGLPPSAAAGIVVIGGLGIVAGIIAASAPSFARQVQDLRPTVEDGIDQFFEWLEDGPIGYSRADVDEALAGLSDQGEAVASIAGQIVITIGEVGAAFVLTLILLFFFVKDGPQIVGWAVRRCPDDHRDAVCAVGSRTWRALGGFMRGTALVALIDAVGIAIGLLVLDVPLVFPLAFLVFLGGFIPVLGALVTGLLAVLVAWAAGGLGTAIAVLAVVIIVQQVESNVLQPVIMRRAVSLHPIVILAAISAGAIIAGIIGAFLAVPIAAMATAAGNELRLRHEARLAGLDLGATPIGGAWATAEVSGPTAEAVAGDAAADKTADGPADDG